MELLRGVQGRSSPALPARGKPSFSGLSHHRDFHAERLFIAPCGQRSLCWLLRVGSLPAASLELAKIKVFSLQFSLLPHFYLSLLLCHPFGCWACNLGLIFILQGHVQTLHCLKSNSPLLPAWQRHLPLLRLQSFPHHPPGRPSSVLPKWVQNASLGHLLRPCHPLHVLPALNSRSSSRLCHSLDPALVSDTLCAAPRPGLGPPL